MFLRITNHLAGAAFVSDTTKRSTSQATARRNGIYNVLRKNIFSQCCTNTIVVQKLKNKQQLMASLIEAAYKEQHSDTAWQNTHTNDEEKGGDATTSYDETTPRRCPNAQSNRGPPSSQSQN